MTPLANYAAAKAAYTAGSLTYFYHQNLIFVVVGKRPDGELTISKAAASEAAEIEFDAGGATRGAALSSAINTAHDPAAYKSGYKMVVINIGAASNLVR